MSSFGYEGSVRMNPEVENEDRDPLFDGEYPFPIPKVFLYGSGEVYNYQYCFNWDDDSVIVVRNNHVVKYTRSNFLELLARNEAGEIVWIDGRNAPYLKIRARRLGLISGFNIFKQCIFRKISSLFLNLFTTLERYLF